MNDKPPTKKKKAPKTSGAGTKKSDKKKSAQPEDASSSGNNNRPAIQKRDHSNRKVYDEDDYLDENSAAPSMDEDDVRTIVDFRFDEVYSRGRKVSAWNEPSRVSPYHNRNPIVIQNVLRWFFVVVC